MRRAAARVDCFEGRAARPIQLRNSALVVRDRTSHSREETRALVRKRDELDTRLALLAAA
jgi:hypothetical protein